LATPKVIRKPLAEVGSARSTGTAAGMAIARVTQKLPAGAGSVPTTATAAGMAIPRVIPKRRAADGKRDIDRNVATTRTDAVEAALARVRVNIAAASATMTIGAGKADTADAPKMTMIAGPRPAGVMAAGRATPRAIPRLRAADGKTAVKIWTL
jgi:hypothetical protein